MASKRRKLVAQIKKAQAHYDIAFNSYTRYTWRPATPTGAKDLAIYEKHR